MLPFTVNWRGLFAKDVAMFISALSADEWAGVFNQGYTIEHPSLEQIESAIRMLDGQIRTLVTIEAEDETHMAIGGGSSGQYVVYATFDNQRFATLVASNSRSSSNRAVVLVAGGQSGDYPERHCVDIEAALRAARAFAVNGSLDSDSTWDWQ